MRTPGIIRRQLKNSILKQKDINQLHHNSFEQTHKQIPSFNEQAQQLINNNDDYIIRLDLSNISLNQIPPTLQSLKNLQILNLSKNNISKLVLPKLQHLKKLIIDENKIQCLDVQKFNNLSQLICNSNLIDVISIPSSLQILKADHNQLTNLYFLNYIAEKNSLTDITLCFNHLYDIKIVNMHAYKKINFTKLKVFKASNNQIMHIEGFQYFSQLNILSLENNKLTLNKDLINELIKIKSIEYLNLNRNNFNNCVYTIQMAQNLLSNSLLQLKNLILEQKYQNSMNEHSSDSLHQQFKQSRYQLFMGSQNKLKNNNEWNFTLGECSHNDSQQAQFQLTSIHSQQILQPSPIFILKKPVNNPNFEDYLQKLLPFSYIPTRPIKKYQKIKTNGLRIQQGQEYNLINALMSHKGGIIYLKKITNWDANNNGHQNENEQLGFFQHEINQKEFNFFSKFGFNKMISKNEIEKVPNIFSYFHILLRFHIKQKRQQYGCIYVIETSHL